MVKVVVTGGGWSGCAAALAAAKAGAEVTLCERTDLLLGTGLAGGIFRNNGRFTAAEESIAMGGGDLFVAMDANTRHRNVAFPGHAHASLYDVTRMEPIVKRVLQNYGIEIRLQTRITNAGRFARTVKNLLTAQGEEITGDVFIDATGTAGPMGQCLLHGNGCSMCVLRCPAYGPRISLCSKLSVPEFKGEKADGSLGAMSGSCKLEKNSLQPELRERLERNGVAVLPLPPEFKKEGTLGQKACSQYALPAFAENLVLLDTGYAKLMTPYFSLKDLRKIKGLEQARYVDPAAGSIGNSVRYVALAPCNAQLKVQGLDNLFCCGEKAGTLVGHTEAIITGLLAGHNAVRHCLDMPYLTLPQTIACGDFIQFTLSRMQEPQGRQQRYTFSGAVYFAHMQNEGLYSIEREEIQARVAQSGLQDIYNTVLV